MTCKPDGTHHYACDCREEVFKKLLETAKMSLTLWHAAQNKTELWEAWADNYGEDLGKAIAQVEGRLK